jgi:hypothetical protein
MAWGCITNLISRTEFELAEIVVEVWETTTGEFRAIFRAIGFEDREALRIVQNKTMSGLQQYIDSAMGVTR